MARIHRVGTIALYVTDLRASRHFYGNGLGLVEAGTRAAAVADGEGTGPEADPEVDIGGEPDKALDGVEPPTMYRIGETRLVLYPTDPADADSGSSRLSRIEVWYEVADLDATVRRLAEQGAPVLQEPTKRPWGTSEAIVLDPDDHPVFLAQSVEEPAAPHGDVGDRAESGQRATASGADSSGWAGFGDLGSRIESAIESTIESTVESTIERAVGSVGTAIDSMGKAVDAAVDTAVDPSRWRQAGRHRDPEERARLRAERQRVRAERNQARAERNQARAERRRQRAGTRRAEHGSSDEALELTFNVGGRAEVVADDEVATPTLRSSHEEAWTRGGSRLVVGGGNPEPALVAVPPGRPLALEFNCGEAAAHNLRAPFDGLFNVGRVEISGRFTDGRSTVFANAGDVDLTLLPGSDVRVVVPAHMHWMVTTDLEAAGRGEWVMGDGTATVVIRGNLGSIQVNAPASGQADGAV